MLDTKPKNYSSGDGCLGVFLLTLFLSFFPILSGILFFLYQCLEYLQTGVWNPHSFMEVVKGCYTAGWADNPQSWIGLHELLERMPLSIGLIVLAPFVGFYGACCIGFAIIFYPTVIAWSLLSGVFTAKTWLESLISAFFLGLFLLWIYSNYVDFKKEDGVG